MEDYPNSTPTGFYRITPPKLSQWHCELLGGPHGVVFTPSEGREPNRFHRWMQELCFGFKWRKK